MSTQGSAKAPDPSYVEHEARIDKPSYEAHSSSNSPWHVWKQVIIGELLNVLERRRYDNAERR